MTFLSILLPLLVKFLVNHVPVVYRLVKRSFISGIDSCYAMVCFINANSFIILQSNFLVRTIQWRTYASMNWSSVFQVMIRRLFGAKSLPLLTGRLRTNLILGQKYQHFPRRSCISKCCRQILAILIRPHCESLNRLSLIIQIMACRLFDTKP